VKSVQRVILMATGTNDDIAKASVLDPEETIPMLVIRRNGATYLLAEVDHDQLSVIKSMCRSKMDFININLDEVRLIDIPVYQALTEA